MNITRWREHFDNMMFLLNETLASAVSDDSHRVNLTEKKPAVFFIVARHLRKYDLIVQG